MITTSRNQPLIQAAAALFLAATLAVAAPVAAFAEGQDPREALLNQIELDPASPASGNLDAYLDELIPTIIDEDEMDTYDQVKACYDYLVDNVSYGSHTRYLGTSIGETTCGRIYSSYGEVEGFGAVALTAKKGMCNAYASAFILMTRKLGVDAYLVEGQTRSSGGGYAYHKWAEVEIDGIAYAFDPQLEQDLRRAGLAKYSVFCKTYDQIPGRYIKY